MTGPLLFFLEVFKLVAAIAQIVLAPMGMVLWISGSDVYLSVFFWQMQCFLGELAADDMLRR